MELKDLLVTPVWLIIIYGVAFVIRRRLSDPVTRKYFIPALTVRLMGAIGMGLIYQFYYDGGDTFNFFTHGSQYIWEAWKDSPLKAIKLIFADGQHHADTFVYSSQIWYYRDLPSYFVVRVVAVLDLLTFHTYSATACLFATISFMGLWSMFRSFYQLYPQLHRSLAIAVLFIPSVFFWGSGIMKDTLTLASVAFIISGMIRILYLKRVSIGLFALMLLCFYIIFSIRIYILLCLVPATLLWFFLVNLHKIRSQLLRLIMTPLILLTAVFASYNAIDQISRENYRYSIDRLSNTAEITAKWINYVSTIDKGSGYILGDFDYSPTGMIKKFPLALNVTLFRPYLWEVRNPVMLLAALESIGVLVFTALVLLKVRLNIFSLVTGNPMLVFLLLFSISFAFAVGFSTYNFGSLVRYKIPLIPLYLSALTILNYTNKERKAGVLATTE